MRCRIKSRSFKRAQPEHEPFAAPYHNAPQASDASLLSLSQKWLRTMKYQLVCSPMLICRMFGVARQIIAAVCLVQLKRTVNLPARARGVGWDGFTVPVAGDMRLSGTVMRVQRIQRSIINSSEPLEGVKIPPHWLIKSLKCTVCKTFWGRTLQWCQCCCLFNQHEYCCLI